MRAEFDNATIKIWFTGQSVSRNIKNVTEIRHDGNLAIIKTAEGKHFLISMLNMNLIEEL